MPIEYLLSHTRPLEYLCRRVIPTTAWIVLTFLLMAIGGLEFGSMRWVPPSSLRSPPIWFMVPLPVPATLDFAQHGSRIWLVHTMARQDFWWLWGSSEQVCGFLIATLIFIFWRSMLQVWREFKVTLILSMNRSLLKLESHPLPSLQPEKFELRNFLRATQQWAIFEWAFPWNPTKPVCAQNSPKVLHDISFQIDSGQRIGVSKYLLHEINSFVRI